MTNRNATYNDQAAPLVMRLGLASVFIVFGGWKLTAPLDWIVFVPPWLSSFVLDGGISLSLNHFLKLTGFAELVLGAQLLLGMFTRTTAVACTLWLAVIVAHVGFDQVGVRDVGLLAFSIALVMTGGGAWSIDAWLTPGRSAPSATTPA